MKNKTGLIVAIVALLCLAGGLIAAMIFGIKHFNSFNHNFSFNSNAPLALEKDFDYDGIKKIYTESDATDIKIFKSETEDNKIKVKIFADENKAYSAENNSDSINISVTGHCTGFCWSMTGSRVEITLPESYEGDFEVKTDAGDLTSEGFSKANFNINSNAGDIEIAAAKAIMIATSAGDIDIREAEEISIESNAGDIKIDKCTNKLHISTDAGDIRINELQLSQDSDIKANAGDISINHAENIYVDAKTDFGDVKVRSNDRHSEIELKIKTNAGDIKVN